MKVDEAKEGNRETKASLGGLGDTDRAFLAVGTPSLREIVWGII